MKAPKLEFIGDGPGKPVGTSRCIGRRSIFAVGNSDGDHQMLQCTTAAAGRASWASCITPMASANTPTAVAYRQTRQGARRSEPARLDRGRYEAPLRAVFATEK